MPLSTLLAGRTRLRRSLEERKVRRVRARLAGPKILHAFALAYPEAVFVEIGSNDGEQLDHLRSLILQCNWRGVMVEPVPYVFERLRDNYAALERVTLENAAITGADGHQLFFHLAQVDDPAREKLPPWYDAIGSFSREHLLIHKPAIPDIEQRVVETRVPCLTFDSLCQKHGLDAVDLLSIDTEGHDYEILRHIDLRRHAPVLVIYEHFHLDREAREACRRMMQQSGYDTMEEGYDTWCLRAGAHSDLRRTWRRARPAVPGQVAYEQPWRQAE